MHDARAIANLILDEFDSVANSISNKKINKLIYYCHAFSLLRRGKPLVKNHVEAWEHGPVFRVVYDSFKSFDHFPVKGRATAYNFGNEAEEIVSDQSIPADAVDLIRKVVSYYLQYSADQLESMTHSQNGPWSQIWNLPESQRGFRSRIPDELIRLYFVKKFGEGSHSH